MKCQCEVTPIRCSLFCLRWLFGSRPETYGVYMLCIVTLQGFVRKFLHENFSNISTNVSLKAQWSFDLRFFRNNDLVANNGDLTPGAHAGRVGWERVLLTYPTKIKSSHTAGMVYIDKCHSWSMSLQDSIYSLFGLTQTSRTIPSPACTSWLHPHDMYDICLWSNRWPKPKQTNRWVEVVFQNQVHWSHNSAALVVLVSGYNASNAYGIRECTIRTMTQSPANRAVPKYNHARYRAHTYLQG